MKFEFYIYFLPSFILFNIAILQFFTCVRTFSKTVKIGNSKSKADFMKFSLFFFCIFGAFAGDWFHYQEEIEELTKYTTIYEQRHLEDIYVWLIEYITGNNYILFRVIIWGISVWILSKGVKRLKLDNVTTWCLFLVISVAVSYAVGRGSLGFSLIVCGYSYLLKPGRNKFCSYFYGVLLLSMSVFCHKSMFLLAPLALLSFVEINIKRTILAFILTMLISVPIRVYVITLMVSGEDVVGSDYIRGEDNGGYSGIGYNLWLYSYYFIIFFFIAYAYFKIVIKKIEVPVFVKRVFNFVLLIFFEYLTVYLAFRSVGIGNDALTFRIFTMINIPLPLVISYLISYKCSKRLFYLVCFSVLMANYFIAYNAYTNL